MHNSNENQNNKKFNDVHEQQDLQQPSVKPISNNKKQSSGIPHSNNK